MTALEIEAIRRAKKNSDTLLIFLLKGHMPQKYRERFEQDVRNDPGIKALLQAVVTVFKGYVPRERVRQAIARLASLTGMRHLDNQENGSVPDGTSPPVIGIPPPIKR